MRLIWLLTWGDFVADSGDVENAAQQYDAHGAAGRAAFDNKVFRRGPVIVAVRPQKA